MASIHEPEFKPIALVGENIALLKSGRTWKYYRVEYIRPLFRSPNLTTDFGAVSASSSISQIVQPDSQLEIKATEIAQLRCKPLDNFEFDLRRGTTDPVAATDDVVTRISKHLEEVDPTWAMTEHFYIHDDLYYIGVYNPYPYALTQTRVAWWGFKYDVTELEEEPEKKNYCPMERW